MISTTRKARHLHSVGRGSALKVYTINASGDRIGTFALVTAATPRPLPSDEVGEFVVVEFREAAKLGSDRATR